MEESQLPTRLPTSSTTQSKLLREPFSCSISLKCSETSLLKLSFGFQRRRWSRTRRREKHSNSTNSSPNSSTPPSQLMVSLARWACLLQLQVCHIIKTRTTTMVDISNREEATETEAATEVATEEVAEVQDHLWECPSHNQGMVKEHRCLDSTLLQVSVNPCLCNHILIK